MLTRSFQTILEKRLSEDEPLIQVLIGPRQVGKTTAVQRIGKKLGPELFYYASADESLVHPSQWLKDQWTQATLLSEGRSILVIDEVQKIDQWSEAVKTLWDQQLREKPKQKRLKVVLLGSSSLALQKGLKESLTGRFEIIHAHHWDAVESQSAFGLTVDQFLSYGGYPGSYSLLTDFPRWFTYMKESIVETVIGKDLLSLRSVHKPALFRQTFELLCRYPAQEVSYTKLLGQIQEKGNVESIKNYIAIYEGAFLFRALQKYSTNSIKVKSSSPKILPLCPAFYAMNLGPNAASDPEERGRLLEVAVGATLNRLPGELYYWRDGNHEVDFVYQMGKDLFAIEVKSGKNQRGGSQLGSGLAQFKTRFSNAKTLLLHEDHLIPFTQNPEIFLKQNSL
jgi:predicted AAA+ superfamily ATPase